MEAVQRLCIWLSGVSWEKPGMLREGLRLDSSRYNPEEAAHVRDMYSEDYEVRLSGTSPPQA